ncbi:MAG: isoprenylcysteine carboxylmethyltransferase family protein [Rhizomicrobium sp.]
MRKSSAILGSFLFLVIAPGTVAGLIPWAFSAYRLGPASPEIWAVRALGILLISAGLLFLLDSFGQFALRGIGTPAPIAPTRHLVVGGYYRYVRNPMYVSVLALILGQALLFGNLALFAYAVIVWAAFYAFVLGYEEPALRTAFDEEYLSYCAHVPRWIPRLRPWKPEVDHHK